MLIDILINKLPLHSWLTRVNYVGFLLKYTKEYDLLLFRILCIYIPNNCSEIFFFFGWEGGGEEENLFQVFVAKILSIILYAPEQFIILIYSIRYMRSLKIATSYYKNM